MKYFVLRVFSFKDPREDYAIESVQTKYKYITNTCAHFRAWFVVCFLNVKTLLHGFDPKKRFTCVAKFLRSSVLGELGRIFFLTYWTPSLYVSFTKMCWSTMENKNIIIFLCYKKLLYAGFFSFIQKHRCMTFIFTKTNQPTTVEILRIC